MSLLWRGDVGRVPAQHGPPHPAPDPHQPQVPSAMQFGPVAWRLRLRQHTPPMTTTGRMHSCPQSLQHGPPGNSAVTPCAHRAGQATTTLSLECRGSNITQAGVRGPCTCLSLCTLRAELQRLADGVGLKGLVASVPSADVSEASCMPWGPALRRCEGLGAEPLPAGCTPTRSRWAQQAGGWRACASRPA